MRVKSILLGAAALLTGSNMFAQYTSTVGTGGQKYVLLEEGTGTWCGWCPDGAQVIEQNIETTYPRAVIASFHNGDIMTLSGDAYNGAFISGFPGGTIDRVAFGSGSKPCMVSRGQWAAKVSGQSLLAPNFDVTLKVNYDTAPRLVTVTVSGKCLVAGTGGWNLNAYIVEDSISSAVGSYQQHSYLYNSSSSWFYHQCVTTCDTGCSACATLPDSVYKHMNVVKKIMAAGGIYGDAKFTNPAVGDTGSKTYTYTLPASYNPKRVKIIGIVQSYSVGLTAASRPIENVISTPLPLIKTVGVEQIDAEVFNMSAFPSPVQSTLNIAIEGILGNDAQLQLLDLSGRIIKTVAVRNNKFDLNMQDYSTGMYLLKYNDSIRNRTIKITKE